MAHYLEIMSPTNHCKLDRFLQVCALAMAVLLSTACAHIAREPASLTEIGQGVDDEALAMALPGKTPWIEGEGIVQTALGRSMPWQSYLPQDERKSGVIILAHGFLRRGNTMADWGRLMASRGFAVYVPDMVNSSLVAGNHELNARDLRLLADRLAPGQRRIYAGFSAGGLSALLAASLDPLAMAWLGLDPVDSGALGANALATFSLPGMALWADPAPCNAHNNLKPAWDPTLARVSNRRSVPIAYSSHGQFEFPLDPATAGFCGEVRYPGARELITRQIHARVIGWLQALE